MSRVLARLALTGGVAMIALAATGSAAFAANGNFVGTWTPNVGIAWTITSESASGACAGTASLPGYDLIDCQVTGDNYVFTITDGPDYTSKNKGVITGTTLAGNFTDSNGTSENYTATNGPATGTTTTTTLPIVVVSSGGLSLPVEIVIAAALAGLLGLGALAWAKGLLPGLSKAGVDISQLQQQALDDQQAGRAGKSDLTPPSNRQGKRPGKNYSGAPSGPGGGNMAESGQGSPSTPTSNASPSPTNSAPPTSGPSTPPQSPTSNDGAPSPASPGNSPSNDTPESDSTNQGSPRKTPEPETDTYDQNPDWTPGGIGGTDVPPPTGLGDA